MTVINDLSVISFLAIMFSIAYGIIAYLSQRESLLKAQSGNEESSLSDKDARRLLLLAACVYQWFVVGYPFLEVFYRIENNWIESLFMIVGKCSSLCVIVGFLGILCNKHLRKARFSLKVADPKLMFTGWGCAFVLIALNIVSIAYHLA